jgi:hypothetical protein
MKPRKTTYLIHRWIGLAVCVQLLAWSAGGFIFSIFPIDNVRGKRDTLAVPFDPISAESVGRLPAPLREAVHTMLATGQQIGDISHHDRGIGPFWEVADTEGQFLARLRPSDGSTLPLISEDEAVQLAMRDFTHNASVSSVHLIETDPPIEYRSGPLPAYAVTLDHPKNPHIYISASTGKITARRNQSWRIFDFFWMLHTMDYTGRDNFNHLLLTSFSLLAMTTAGSGLILWAWRLKPRRTMHQTV